MSVEELQVIRLRNDFYRDGFQKLVFALGVILTAIILLMATSLYLFFTKPLPVSFAAGDEWRVLPPVPVNKPYLNTADLLQWVNETFSTIFNFDFLNYATKHTEYERYFTDNGWKKYNDLLNIYAPANAIQNSKSVVTGVPDAGPFIINQDVLPGVGVYAWWVQIPIKINFNGFDKSYAQAVTLQVLVIRVPTLNNLSGVAIDNLIIGGRS